MERDCRGPCGAVWGRVGPCGAGTLEAEDCPPRSSRRLARAAWGALFLYEAFASALDSTSCSRPTDPSSSPLTSARTNCSAASTRRCSSLDGFEAWASKCSAEGTPGSASGGGAQRRS
eukprot:3303955-Rhodomonas_salina.3